MSSSSVPPRQAATFVTLSDERYFVGTVGLVNSLRLTGHSEPVVVVDLGLTSSQRKHLSQACDLRPPPIPPEGTLAVIIKAAVGLLGLHGTIVLIDSDMIVTSGLETILAEASRGLICGFESGPSNDRRFVEWQEALELRGSLRSQPYVNSGFLALDADRWEGLLRRWWELSARISVARSKLPQAPPDRFQQPFGFPEQDVLNAILMSETPAEAIRFLDYARAATPLENRSTRIVDRARLRCTNDSQPTFLLHYLHHPKPWWGPEAATRLHFDAYVELLARLLAAEDVAIRLDREGIPAWLRDNATGRALRYVLSLQRPAKRMLAHFPASLQTRVRRIARGLIPSKNVE